MSNLQNQLREAGYEGDFTLSALVYAIGDSFSYLRQVVPNSWEAIAVEKEGRKLWASGYKSPEEAVARLAIALTKKEEVKQI